MNGKHVFAFLALAGAVPAQATERSPVLPLFEEVWSGKNAPELPADIVDPALLHARLLAEGPSEKWNAGVVAPTLKAIDRIRYARVLARSVTCSASVCEVMVVLQSPIMANGVNIGERMTMFVAGDMDTIAKSTGARVSTVIGGGTRPEEHGLLIYTYWN